MRVVVLLLFTLSPCFVYAREQHVLRAGSVDPNPTTTCEYYDDDYDGLETWERRLGKSGNYDTQVNGFDEEKPVGEDTTLASFMVWTGIRQGESQTLESGGNKNSSNEKKSRKSKSEGRRRSSSRSRSKSRERRGAPEEPRNRRLTEALGSPALNEERDEMSGTFASLSNLELRRLELELENELQEVC